jgi:hypothetical protein
MASQKSSIATRPLSVGRETWPLTAQVLGEGWLPQV